MLHWYRLAEHTLQSHRSLRGSDSSLIADQRSSPSASLSPQERRKLFWLGLLEIAPLLIGGLLSIYADWSSGEILLCAVAAVVLSFLICWRLRHQTPLTRIEFTSTKQPGEQARAEVARQL